MTDQFQNREQIATEYKWNLESMYPDFKKWEEDFKKIDPLTEKIEAMRPVFATSSEYLKKNWDLLTELDLIIEKLYSYAHHLSDQDTRNTDHLAYVDRVSSKATEVSARLSYMDPELLAQSSEVLKNYSNDPKLKDYSRRLELLLRSKPHQRTAEIEEILSLASEPLSGSYKTFSLLENADMPMPKVKLPSGEETEVNHGNYSTLLENPDRQVRKLAYEAYMAAFKQYQNTLAATLDSHVKKQVFYAKVRKFPSAIEASLFSDAIPLSVYNGLIDQVHHHLPLLHRWVALKQKVLNLPDFQIYDQFVPMVKPKGNEIPYSKAKEWVLESARPLGDEYFKTLESAFKDRWIDVYYTPGKRSGAYSGGMYTSMPFILLNHKNNLGSAFTLAHELGHSMHSELSRKNQPYAKANYPIFLAEVASTTNEMLLHFYLMKNSDSKEMTMYLLDHLFTSFRSTLYRQVQFAEFERDIHAMVEKGEPLTSHSLSQHYKVLNEKYYGPTMQKNDLIANEWSRIPHFYYNFYVYKYSTSFCAAQYFAKEIFSGNTQIRDLYLNFLKSGGSEDPLETLRKAGMDLSKPEPIQEAFKVFDQSLNEFEKML